MLSQGALAVLSERKVRSYGHTLSKDKRRKQSGLR